ncbi:Hypothetical protein FKW44_025362 [Caligus rogercresseyi]|uniref:Uncharacterized protein n=1 Tax=Caligus rogercresseyi TaxID=217165 RepID=A0A7T8GLL8_CALRO|nr:Hypothetical protein FKW44_025362 [Caligus rogercresseyi]
MSFTISSTISIGPRQMPYEDILIVLPDALYCCALAEKEANRIILTIGAGQVERSEVCWSRI